MRGWSSLARLLVAPRVCAACWSARLAHAPAGLPAVDVKAALRQLYLRVHPDLFTRSPHEQAVNQRSFALLQEWLSQAVRGSPEQHGRSHAFAFEFFVRLDDEEGKEGEQRATELRRVALTLPPPGRRAAGTAEGSLAPSTALALGKLLAACGLSGNFTGSLDAPLPDTGLLDLLPQAAEELRQAESAARRPEDVTRMVRAALRMARGIMLSFAAGAPAEAAGRAELAQALAKALDTSPDGFMRGCSVVLGDCFGVDPGTGAVWLDCRGSMMVDQWPERLRVVDTDAAACARKAAAARRVAEQQVAMRCGLSLLCVEGALGRSHAYSQFLTSLGDTASARGHAAGGALIRVPMRVGPAPHGGSVTAGFEHDVPEALLAVPITATGDDVYAFLEHAGPACAAARAEMAEAERRASHAALLARRSLRLKHLQRGEGVSLAAYETACSRLIAARAALAPLVEGLPLRIVPAGGRAGLASDAHIDVPADFQLRRA